MNAKRLTLLVATGLIVTGCGLTADVLNHGSQTAATDLTAGKTSLTVARAAAAATAATQAPALPQPAPPPAPQVVVVADEGNFSGTTFEVALVGVDGHVLASTQVPQDARWTVGNGPGAAYWVTGGNLKRLDEHGVVTSLAAVPSTQAGRVVLSPDGSQWAYATTSQNAQGVIINRLYSGAPGRPARLIAQRTADPNHPSADTPGLWQYYLLSWTASGILIERQPVGGCGCGTPFDMQMSAGYAALVDPVTGTTTPLGASPSCPLSGAAADGTLACFQVTPTGASSALQLISAMHTTLRYGLSGRSDGGAAVFNGSTLAYATVPSNAGGCGGPDWRPQTTLHVMEVKTGDARTVGGVGLFPVLWLTDGSIVATLSVARSNGSTSSVVVVDPTNGTQRTLFNKSTTVVGLA